MKTLFESIKAWKEGKTIKAFSLYRQDEGSLNISYKTFCEKFPSIVKTDNDRVEAEKAHFKFNWGG